VLTMRGLWGSEGGGVSMNVWGSPPQAMRGINCQADHGEGGGESGISKDK
jgi:hypothetical protein